MTWNELAIEVKVRLNKVDTSFNRDVRIETILMFLNDSCKKLVLDKVDRLKAVTTRTTSGVSSSSDSNYFQADSRLEAEIAYLVDTKEIVLQDSKATLDSLGDYIAIVGQQAYVAVGSAKQWVKNCKIKKIGDIYQNDPFMESRPSQPCLIHKKDLEAVEDGFTIEKVKLDYVKYPIRVSITDLNEEVPYLFASEIVDKATFLLLESIQSPRVNTFSATNDV